MEAGPVRMTLAWRVPAGAASGTPSALKALMLRTRAAPGCPSCSLSTEAGARVGIRYVAVWESESDLQCQIRSNDFAQLAELMEQATERPVVQFELPRGTEGIEYAERVRRVVRR